MAWTARVGPGFLRGACCLILLLGAAGNAAAASEAYALNEVGVRLTARGQYREAAAAFGQALRLSPGDPVIRRNYARLETVLGHRFLAGGQVEQAREAYATAIELSPEEASAFLGLGDVQLRLRDVRGAVESYRRAIALDPGGPAGYARLGEALFQQGDAAGSVAEWERALALDAGNAPLRERLEGVRREARVAGGYRSRESQHFRIVYEGGRQEDVGRELLAILERAYADVGYELGAYPPYEVETIFYADRDFAEATGASAGVGGYYHPIDGKIRVALRGLDARAPGLRSLLYHEYTHALIHALARGNSPPRWVHEGLAVRMERGRADVFRAEALRQARAGSVPSLDASPYVHGSVAMEYLIERHGLTAVQGLLRSLGDGTGFREAFRAAYGMELEAFQERLREVLVRGY
ncbi:MAG: tetratricopeptide repeat protein [candidate division NC10 bacterium]|nr:tetratricopeptide repeat protein [candidate division NC10 bacterium]